MNAIVHWKVMSLTAFKPLALNQITRPKTASVFLYANPDKRGPGLLLIESRITQQNISRKAAFEPRRDNRHLLFLFNVYTYKNVGFYCCWCCEGRDDKIMIFLHQSDLLWQTLRRCEENTALLCFTGAHKGFCFLSVRKITLNFLSWSVKVLRL